MMKLTFGSGRLAIVVMAISVASVPSSAQERKITEKEVPAVVINAFKAAYPTATIKGYAREKENGSVFYEIESKDRGTGRDVLYNADGSVAEIEETVAGSDLPSAVREIVRSKYPGAVITKAEKTMQGEKVEYEVIVRQRKKRITLEFDADGNLKNKTN